jgi:organic radical activating enzyme
MSFQEIPFKDITKFGQINMLERPLFSVSWILGRFCNYKCSYCWPHARTDKYDFYDIEIYKNAVDEIKKQARQNEFTEFHWSFSGGEPTAYKNLIELTNHIEDGVTPYQSIHMTTNLSPGSKWWRNWVESTELFQRRSITASYHAEFAKEQEFGDKCLYLMNWGVLVTINQVMVPNQFDELYERMERFAARGINVTLKPQSDPTASFVVRSYTDEMINVMQTHFPQSNNGVAEHQIKLYDSKDNEYLFDQAERFNSFGFNKFRGWYCNAGYQSIVIHSNEVKRSHGCADFLLGTLDAGFDLNKNSKRCLTASCVSSADSKIPKTKL